MIIRVWWKRLPAPLREALRSYAVSTLLGLWPALRAALSVGVGLGVVVDLKTALHFLAISSGWLILGVFFDLGPYYRARQGGTAAANTVNLEGGAKAVIIPAKGSA